MTYIIIHKNDGVRKKYLINLINKYQGSSYTDYDEITERPDIHIVKPEKKESITIEQAKELQKKIIYSPFESDYQFGVIMNAQLMTKEAQNALLKTLEEQSDKTVLVLLVNNEKSVLDTILSRCTRIYPKEQQEDPNEDLDVEIGRDFAGKDLAEKIAIIDDFLKEKKEAEFVLNLMKYYQSEYNAKLTSGEDYSKEQEILKILSEAQFRLTKNSSKKIVLEYLSFKLFLLEN